ncbi:MAG: aminotransferase class I/II-fold pyridoxal phosphate-dependent enzyme [Comamonadaceae bacterium]|nr:aminotransferase class I/II-fold pyridoxal phosphate-dependent enzyme [Comamonadaceae bacterium]
MRPGPAARVLRRRAWSRAWRRGSREAVAALEAAGAEIVDVSLPAHGLRPRRPTTSSPRPRRRRTSPATTASATGTRVARRRRPSPTTWPRAGAGFGAGGEAADHARHLRALGRLLRRLLPARRRRCGRSSRRDFDAAFEQGIDALVAPTSPDRRLAVRREDRRPGRRCTSPTPARCRSTWPACPASPSRAASPTACRSACSSSARPGREARLARARRGPTRRSPPAPPGAASSRRPRRRHRPPGRPRPSEPPRSREGTDVTDTRRRARPLAEPAPSPSASWPVPPSGIRRFFDIVGDDGATSSASGWGSPTSPRRRRSSRRASPACAPSGPTTRATSARIELRRALADPPRAALRRRLRPGDARSSSPSAPRRPSTSPCGRRRPGRRGHPPRAVVRRLRPGDRLRRRRRPPRRDPLRGRLRPRSGGGRGGDHAAHQGALPRLSLQPDRRRPAARPSRTSWRAIAVRHDLLVYSRRDLRPPRLRRLPPPGDERAARACASGRSCMGGFSKAYAMTGWRVGYVCAPAAILEGIVKVHQYGIMSAPTTAQDAALVALTSADADVERDARRVRPAPAPVRGRPERHRACRDVRAARRLLRLPAASPPTGLDERRVRASGCSSKQHVAAVPGSAFWPVPATGLRPACAARRAYEKLRRRRLAPRIGRLRRAHARGARRRRARGRPPCDALRGGHRDRESTSSSGPRRKMFCACAVPRPDAAPEHAHLPGLPGPARRPPDDQPGGGGARPRDRPRDRGDGPAGDPLGPQELLLPGPAQGLPDQPVRPAARRRAGRSTVDTSRGAGDDRHHPGPPRGGHRASSSTRRGAGREPGQPRRLQPRRRPADGDRHRAGHPDRRAGPRATPRSCGSLLRTIDVSDAEMENGQMRVRGQRLAAAPGHRGVRDPDRGQEHELAPLGGAGDRLRDRAPGGGVSTPASRSARRRGAGTTPRARTYVMRVEGELRRLPLLPGARPAAAPSRPGLAGRRSGRALPELPGGPPGALRRRARPVAVRRRGARERRGDDRRLRGDPGGRARTCPPRRSRTS